MREIDGIGGIGGPKEQPQIGQEHQGKPVLGRREDPFVVNIDSNKGELRKEKSSPLPPVSKPTEKSNVTSEQAEFPVSSSKEKKPGLREPNYPGGKIEVRGELVTEYFQEREDKPAILANGTHIDLPYTNYQARNVTSSDHESFELASSVNYNDLSEEEKAAVEIAVDADERQLHRTETFPEYQRLALRPGNEGEPDQLHSVIFQDGYHQRMYTYPDNHGFITSETESQLDRPVELAEPVSDGYLVAHHNGEYMYAATYRDHEPNFFGPKDKFANAFWIAGNPRTVYSEDLRLMNEYEDVRPEPRYTIVPVRYYKVAYPTRPRPDNDPLF